MGVRIAATLSGLVGVLSILTAAAVGIPALGGADGSIQPLAVGLVAGAGACVAALLLWRRKRAGVVAYVDVMRTTARVCGVSMRELDRALWAYSKWHQPAGK